ncbi:MAG: aminotransferase class I/II-fold pyridoxal phosphate-dependent enzyme [Prevotellaceae bacterium]|jgi:O-acetylhomoserine (thiol)-lyase|nr:aminotransferase class I/II-fold pyridoxal phosphate-dependent enzyme [Prevotellaceae bacterium]
MKFETLQIHAGQIVDPATQACATPIYQTVSYAFKNAQHGANLFELKEAGNIYTRMMNPTSDVFEQRIAALEGGIGALALSSGQSAEFVVINTLVKKGENFVTAPFLYGGTHTLFSVSFARFGIEARFAKSERAEDFEALIDENTKALYVESIGNPGYIVPDFAALAALANKYGIPLIVDNTLGAAGYLVRPLDFGAHILVESATKFIGGHGTAMGGIIVDGRTFNWANGNFPDFTEPSASYHGLRFYETFGNSAFIVKARVESLRDFGSCQSPFNSFLLLQGIQTLSLRMERHCSNAFELAQWLQKQPFVDKVIYLGLDNHPSHQLAKKYMKNGFGSMISFEIKGSKQQASRFTDNLKLITQLANMGDTRSLIVQPAATTHQQMSEAEQLAASVTPNLLRLSVGIEHIDDIKEDILQAAYKLCIDN